MGISYIFSCSPSGFIPLPVSRKVIISQGAKGSGWGGEKADDPEKTRLVELNKEFYEAMNTGDFHSISSLWLQDDYVQFYWGDYEEVTG